MAGWHAGRALRGAALWSRAFWALGATVALAALIGSSVFTGGPPGAALAAPVATVTLTPSASPSAAQTDADPFATGQPLPAYLQSPDAWAWHAALPGARVVLYYGVAYSPGTGVVGEYGGDDAGLLNRLQNQAQAYAQADPTHPVMTGLDLVDPLADAYPQASGFYIDRMDSSVIQHYVDLTRQHHVLLFLDMQIERSTVQRELAFLWPYLQLPWVHLAFDPEWDESHDGQAEGCGLIFDPNHEGRAYASEVNYLADQLSALAQTEHLPPKILVVHGYKVQENPQHSGYCNNAKPNEGWQNIHLAPGVQTVLNVDGVGSSVYGGPGAKIEDYHAVLGDVPGIKYSGFKLYYYFPDVPGVQFYDSPLMTPQQVLALDPPPLVIMYA